MQSRERIPGVRCYQLLSVQDGKMLFLSVRFRVAALVVAFAIGGGAKLFCISDDKSVGLERVVPTPRLTIGYAF